MTFQKFFIGDYTLQIPLSFEVIHQENEELMLLSPPTYHSTARIYICPETKQLHFTNLGLMKVRIAEDIIQIIPLKQEEYSFLNLNRDYIDLMEE
ncbi:hypothetical protein NQ540_09015 [Granulicatella adiacens ATCC 49175]|uniref:Uncharacterized protein n=1 Tax=Granulicatella adiacens ATCC 49175 TaxID=638301 RepID=C8NIP4_9LACT|nr:hypothetical protein [Granulicatella adiacens]EEW36441.1 hypothetical protein HMPREF0444_1789 [Granulicatella adiacens ATCC 49175]UAK92991.1 hypothetical protein K8O88_05580 [Granulicatella adiacens]UWP38025.1 hypothetical protein NQ540_09015 [Granulicatella adiacens ATCC 49175]